MVVDIRDNAVDTDDSNAEDEEGQISESLDGGK